MRLRKSTEPHALGSFEEQVMLAVLRTGGEAYGMNVRREIEKVTRRDVTIGSVYITLDRLEAKKLVTSARKVARSESLSRRVFSVTPAGLQALEGTKSMRDRLWQGVDLRQSLRQRS